MGLSEMPISALTEITCSGSNKVFSLPSEEMFIIPTLPKLSSAKLTSDVPSGLLSILNRVPLISSLIVGSSITIDPLSFFAILPDSITAEPLSTIPIKMSFNPEISNSFTLNELDSFIIIVELSSYCAVAEDNSFVKISSFNKISSYKSNNLFFPSLSIA